MPDGDCQARLVLGGAALLYLWAYSISTDATARANASATGAQMKTTDEAIMAIALGFFLTLSAIAVSGCTNEGASDRALLALGLTDIHYSGYAWFACSEDDTFATEFSATAQQGGPVSGAVCCGWLKGCTVRFR